MGKIVEIIDDLSTLKLVFEGGNYTQEPKGDIKVSLNANTVTLICRTDRYDINYEDVTTPAVASAVLLEQAINVMLDNVAGGGGGGGATYTTGAGATDVNTLRGVQATDSPDVVSLASIDTKLDSQATAANQGIAKTTASATGISIYRTVAVGNTADNVKLSAGNIYGFRITNKSATAIFVKIYNVANATSANTPVMVISVPAGDGSANLENFTVGRYFSTAISVRCVTGTGDANTTPPATLPIIEIDYN